MLTSRYLSHTFPICLPIKQTIRDVWLFYCYLTLSKSTEIILNDNLMCKIFLYVYCIFIQIRKIIGLSWRWF